MASTIVADDPSVTSLVALPGIDIVKVTEGFVWNPVTQVFDPVAAGDGITVTAGEAVTWTYTVTNTGDFALADVVVNDDNGTPADPSDDFVATYVSGDTDTDDLLDVDETWVFTASGIANRGTTTTSATRLVWRRILLGYRSSIRTVMTRSSMAAVTRRSSPTTRPATSPTVGRRSTSRRRPTVSRPTIPAGDQTDVNNTVPYVSLGSPVTWQYVITNIGDVDLLVDGFTDDRIADVSTLCAEGTLFPVTLAPTDAITCTVAGTAVMQPGDLYVNVSDVVGNPVDENGDPIVDQTGAPGLRRR